MASALQAQGHPLVQKWASESAEWRIEEQIWFMGRDARPSEKELRAGGRVEYPMWMDVSHRRALPAASFAVRHDERCRAGGD